MLSSGLLRSLCIATDFARRVACNFGSKNPPRTQIVTLYSSDAFVSLENGGATLEHQSSHILTSTSSIPRAEPLVLYEHSTEPVVHSFKKVHQRYLSECASNPLSPQCSTKNDGCQPESSAPTSCSNAHATRSAMAQSPSRSTLRRR